MVEHVCGLQGFGLHLNDKCSACEERKKPHMVNTPLYDRSGALHLPVSLRDYFAAAALTSMTTAPDYSKGPCNEVMAERAYIIADCMLAERSKS